MNLNIRSEGHAGCSEKPSMPKLAIDTEVQRRRMAPFEKFVVPTTWRSGYDRLSKPVPHYADYRTVELASELAARLIDPALSGATQGKAWSADEMR